MKKIIIVLSALFCLGWTWDDFSIKREPLPPLKLKTVWTISVIGDGILRPRFEHGSPPLIAGDIVVQGNLINGIKAYQKDKGRLLWSFKIQPGAAGPILLYKGNLYFGGADGFFYSVELTTGQLNWKFWTGSENLSAPLIHEDKIYWTTNDQKIYAVSLEGQKIWIYSVPISVKSKDFIVRGRPRPSAYKNLLYTAFYPGHLLALDKDTGKLKWKVQLSSSHSVREDLAISRNCLFVPVFDFYLFCLKPLNGKVVWKTKGGSSSYLTGDSVIYQFHNGTLYALEKFNGKVIWEKKIKKDVLPLPVTPFKNYLIYGSSSKGKLTFASSKTGETLLEHKFGRGLSAPVSIDEKSRNIYFFSIDGYLHKLSVLIN